MPPLQSLTYFALHPDSLSFPGDKLKLLRVQQNRAQPAFNRTKPPSWESQNDSQQDGTTNPCSKLRRDGPVATEEARKRGSGEQFRLLREACGDAAAGILAALESPLSSKRASRAPMLARHNSFGATSDYLAPL